MTESTGGSEAYQRNHQHVQGQHALHLAGLDHPVGLNQECVCLL